MSSRHNDTANYSRPFDANNSPISSGHMSRSQHNDNMGSDYDTQSNATSHSAHHDNISGNLNTTSSNQNNHNMTATSSMNLNNTTSFAPLRQTHQSNTPTPLRQNTTAASLGQSQQSGIAAYPTTSFPSHNKSFSSSSDVDMGGVGTNNSNSSTAFSSSSPTSKQPPTPESSANDPHSQNPNIKTQPRNSQNPHHTQLPTHTTQSTSEKPNKKPWVDPRYDPNLTLAQRLEASTDLPLAPFSEYEWKKENEYVYLTSWQPPVRGSEEWDDWDV